MRLAPDATPDMEEQSTHEKQPVIRCIEKEEELCIGEDGLISVVPVDAKSRMKKLKKLLECREDELQQAAQYGLGLLETNGELQMQVATLKIQLETETEELLVDRNTWQRRTEQAQQETAQWKRKFARAEEEKAELAEEFECFVRRCDCSRQDTEQLANDCTSSSGHKCSDHLDTIAQLQRELQDVQAAHRVKESELLTLQLWKEGEVQQQQEALACELISAQKGVTDIAEVEEELAATQRTMRVLTDENDMLRELAEKHEEDMRTLKKHLRSVEAGKDDAEILSNELSEKLLSLESRCTRLQRELELLQHVSYFTQAVVDCDDEESDEDDGIDEEKGSQTAVLDTDQIENTDTTQAAESLENGDVPLTVRTKRQRSGLVEPGTPRTLCPTPEEASYVQAPESEHEMNAKLHHYFHLTALSIIHENSLHERCFDSSSRLTIDMWHREVIAKEVPFLLWHSWLINRIGEVAMLVQDEGGVPQEPTRAPNVRGAFFRFPLLKLSGNGGATPRNNPTASPPSVSSSPASSPVARVPFAVARAFFRLVRKRTRAAAEPSPVGGSPACGASVE